ncbi:MAG TPA: PaaI family thioesterase [Acidimicrobiia bacterium]|nr:PaaI family thioesterase [Acidimicrobiia bacterium]
MVLPTLPPAVDDPSDLATFTGPLPFSEIVDRVRLHYDDGCFACGRANTQGLGIDHFELEGEVVGARFRSQPQHRGTFGVVHGGLTAAALDEIMAWSGIVLANVLCVTANLQIRFRKPVPLDRDLAIRGWLDSRSGRRLQCRGELLLDGEVAAEGSGLYVVAHRVADLLGI